MKTSIIDLQRSDGVLIDQISLFLSDCFKKYSPNWLPNVEAYREEVMESFDAKRCSRVIINDKQNALGWVGAIVDDNV